MVQAFSVVAPPPPSFQQRPGPFATKTHSTRLFLATTSNGLFDFPDDSSSSRKKELQPQKHQQQSTGKASGSVPPLPEEDENDENQALSLNSMPSSSSSFSSPPPSAARSLRFRREAEAAQRFATGDDVHELRQQVWKDRRALEMARLDEGTDSQAVLRLERSIVAAQLRDAEFVYEISLERQALAERAGRHIEAQKHAAEAQLARQALPQFQLDGLWVGKYGEQGFELINVTYVGDTLVAHKLTGHKNVGKGQITFQVDLSPNSPNYNHHQQQNNKKKRTASPPYQTSDSAATSGNHGYDDSSILEPIELGPQAATQWGARFLSRFAGQGQVAAADGSGAQWIDGQLILVGDYFSFAWLPIGHQVFFGRPSAELTLKLLRESASTSAAAFRDATCRNHLQRCWDETEHLHDELEVSSSGGTFLMGEQQHNYYHQDGCFE